MSREKYFTKKSFLDLASRQLIIRISRLPNPNDPSNSIDTHVQIAFCTGTEYYWVNFLCAEYKNGKIILSGKIDEFDDIDDWIFHTCDDLSEKRIQALQKPFVAIECRSLGVDFTEMEHGLNSLDVKILFERLRAYLRGIKRSAGDEDKKMYALFFERFDALMGQQASIIKEAIGL